MTRSFLVCPIACILALWVAGCATPKPIKPPRAAAKPVAAAVSRPSPQTVAALNAAQLKINQAKRLTGSYTDSDALMNEARPASARGDNLRAQELAREAQTRAELALDGYYITASAQELQQIYAITGLSDDQLARVREAEVALVRGDGSRAHALLVALNKELTTDKKHQVQSGDSLWSISARPEVYANGFLWPLIWEANKDKIKNPNLLYQGQSLRIKPNPTVDEVVKAVEYARQQMGTRVRIGEVKEESP